MLRAPASVAARLFVIDQPTRVSLEVSVEGPLLEALGDASGFLENPTLDATGKRRAFARFGGLEGRMLGPYRLIRELGRGARSAVYEAHDELLGKMQELNQGYKDEINPPPLDPGLKVD